MLRKLLILSILMLAMALPAYAQTDEPTEQSIADIVIASTEDENGQFNTLFAAIQAADPTVLEALANLEAEYTVFAPTDDAFANFQESIGADAFNGLTANPEQVTNLLLFHVVEGRYTAADLRDLNGQSLTTLQGAELEIRVEGETIFAHEAEVTSADVEATNGMIHVINQVLILPAEEAAESTQEVAEASTAEATQVATEESVQSAATTEPTQAATEASEDAQTAGGESADVTGAEATADAVAGVQPDAEATADVPAVPVETDATAEAEATLESAPAEETNSDATPVPELIKAGTIADVVLTQAANPDAPEFTTLLAAILASDPSVVALLSDESANLTVFAPTDEAFVAMIEALGSDQFAAVIGDKSQLTNLLLYHVVDGRQASADLVGLNGQALATLLEGQTLQITTDANGAVLVNGIPVATADIEASNGVIHVITGVLSPIGQNAEESGNESEGE